MQECPCSVVQRHLPVLVGLRLLDVQHTPMKIDVFSLKFENLADAETRVENQHHDRMKMGPIAGEHGHQSLLFVRQQVPRAALLTFQNSDLTARVLTDLLVNDRQPEHPREQPQFSVDSPDRSWFLFLLGYDRCVSSFQLKLLNEKWANLTEPLLPEKSQNRL